MRRRAADRARAARTYAVHTTSVSHRSRANVRLARWSVVRLAATISISQSSPIDQAYAQHAPSPQTAANTTEDVRRCHQPTAPSVTVSVCSAAASNHASGGAAQSRPSARMSNGSEMHHSHSRSG